MSDSADDAPEPPFLDGLAARIEARRADGRRLAVAVIDCGVVGRIDGVWGYMAGDAARARLTAGLRSEALRSGDIAGEMGRDDIACVLSVIDGPDVALLAAGKMLRGLAAPLWFGDDEIYAQPAVGLAIFPEDGDDAQTLLQKAKSASLAARHMPDRAALHAPDLKNPDGIRLLFENRLRTAVADDALEMVFQPKYDLQLGQICGIEAHLRWPDAKLGIVPSADAFAAAEAAGVVPNLLSSMLNRALRNRSEFRYSAGVDVRIAINLPARVLMYTEIPDLVERALRTWGVGAARLMIELSDTALLQSEPVARETLAALAALGLKLSIDDPNVTVASLFRLAGMRFHEFKIDLASVHGAAGLEQGGDIVRSLVELAHGLKLEVGAVGVPDDETATQLKDLRCDYMQSETKGPALDPAGFVARYGDGSQ